MFRVTCQHGGRRNQTLLGHCVEQFLRRDNVPAPSVGVDEARGDVKVGSEAQFEGVGVDGPGGVEGAGFEEGREGEGVGPDGVGQHLRVVGEGPVGVGVVGVDDGGP